MKTFPHIALFVASFAILAGCRAHAQTAQNVTPHDQQPIQPVIVTVDPTGPCTNYALTYVNWKTGIQTVCANGSYLSSSAGGGGTVGPQGPKGDTGATGPTGPTGPAGAAATITVGTTTTLAAGSNATVTNTGTSSAAVFNFGIPKGADGTGGGGGSGPFNYFAASASGSVLKVGTDCATVNCPAAVGAVTYDYKWESDATANAGATDVVFAYIDSANPTGLTFGSSGGAVTCSEVGGGTGCFAVSGISNFPPNSIPLYRWVLDNGTFQGSPDFDARSAMRTNVVSSSGCILTTQSQASTVVSWDTSNPSCALGSSFNGGTITTPLFVHGTGTNPLLGIAFTDGTQYGIAADMTNDAGKHYQIGLAGSSTGTQSNAPFLYDNQKSEFTWIENINTGALWVDQGIQLNRNLGDPGTCDANHYRTITTDSTGRPEFCDGTAWHHLQFSD